MKIDLSREGFEAFLKQHIEKYPNNNRFAKTAHDEHCPIATWIVNQGFMGVQVSILQVHYCHPKTGECESTPGVYPWMLDYIRKVDFLHDSPAWITAEEALKVLNGEEVHIA